MEWKLELIIHIIVPYQTRVSVWFSTLIFPFYKTLFMSRLEFSFSAVFLSGFLKPEKSLVFFEIRQ
jgi:hypothetical protein